MATIAITYVGGPTALLEIGGLRLLTDPTFDPAGGRYNFGLGATSRKLQGPAMTPEELGRVDAVLLSHDQHDDNLDAAGRELLGELGAQVLTTPAGAGRLGDRALGLAPWSTTALALPDGGELKLTATPCRHGPPLSGPIVGQVTGFVLEWPGQAHGALWWSGDTVYFKGVAEVGERFDVGTAILNLGGVRFPLSGPARYTLNAAEAVRLARDLKLRTLVPLHFEGWKHFRQAREEVEREFAGAGIAERVRWPLPAERIEVEV
jgi:L-ascorbate metabolism protein UlaG (beta-lactamase superfamily)